MTFGLVAGMGNFEYLEKLRFRCRKTLSDKGIEPMVRIIVGVLAASLGLVLLAGCGSSTPTVAEIGNDKLTLDQFEQKYAKYNGGWEKSSTASMQEKESFLDLLVKFELKVTEARHRGLDRDSSVQAELAANDGGPHIRAVRTEP